MNVVAISQDLYNSGVALARDGVIAYAVNEERFTRQKNHGGFPREALAALFAYNDLSPADVDAICVAGIMTPPLPSRIFPSMHDWLHTAQGSGRFTWRRQLADFVISYTPITLATPQSLTGRMVHVALPHVLRRQLPKPLRGVPLSFVDHHLAHAASGYHLSGYGEALCVTADGLGDGVSFTVNRCVEGRIERLHQISARNSFGLFFEALTEAYGYKPCQDEGKLTGLAACGDPASVDVPSPIVRKGETIFRSGPRGHRAVLWARDALLGRYSREDVAAWAQAILEENLLALVRPWLTRTGLHRLVVAGGIFGNVKLNQRLHEMEEVESLFVCPNMGDGGLATGALCLAGHVRPEQLKDVFWGEEFPESAMETALRSRQLPLRKYDDIAPEIARELAAGRTVARFAGRMEWGPRALGNRSILAPATDAALVSRLNAQLRRTDFMPFAPAILAEDAALYLHGTEKAAHAAEFMTVCFRCSDLMRAHFPAVVHVDGTARAQLVREDKNPALHAVLREYRKLSGHGVLLNTSFNIHEEPIVRTPEEAVEAFRSAGLDCLAMGPFLAKSEHAASAASPAAGAAAQPLRA